MPLQFTFFAALCAIGGVVSASRVQVQRFEAQPSWDESNTHHRRRQSGINPQSERKDLYWFGNYVVGDSGSLPLLIDTGSSDLLIDPGFYKPSKNEKPYNSPTFNITYEGVNRKGTGYENIQGTIHRDTVSAAGLTVKQQPLGNVTKYKVVDAPPKKHAIPLKGIIGFCTPLISSFVPPANSWIYSLCNTSAIAECRFALAFGTNNKGLQVLGEVDNSLFKGNLTYAPFHQEIYPLYTVRGDVALNNKVFFPNQTLVFDSGTSNMQSPLNVAKKIFNTLGWHYSTSVGGANPSNPSENITFTTAYFPCDQPPTLSFTFPAKSDLANPPKGKMISKTSVTLDLFKSEWVLSNLGNNNCSAILSGTNALDDPADKTSAWLVGQPFYQGHYVDHNIDGSALGFANLVNPSNVGGS